MRLFRSPPGRFWKAVGAATEALATSDELAAQSVIDDDHEIDRRYLDIEHRVFV